MSLSQLRGFASGEPGGSERLTAEEEKMIISAKRKRAEITKQLEISSPIDTIEAPKKWVPIAEGFIEAVDLVKEVASSDQNTFVLTCIHITPELIEAADEFQVARVVLPTGMQGESLIRRDSLRHICALDLTKISETSRWLHFKNKEGLRISCRKANDLSYVPVNECLAIDGATETPLPKSLGEMCDRAEVFSAEHPDENMVRVEFCSGRVKIRGKGVKGVYTETKKVRYDGPKIAFHITPKLMSSLAARYDTCSLSAEKIRVGDDHFSYVSVLGLGGDEE